MPDERGTALGMTTATVLESYFPAHTCTSLTPASPNRHRIARVFKYHPVRVFAVPICFEHVIARRVLEECCVCTDILSLFSLSSSRSMSAGPQTHSLALLLRFFRRWGIPSRWRRYGKNGTLVAVLCNLGSNRSAAAAALDGLSGRILNVSSDGTLQDGNRHAALHVATDRRGV